MLWATYTAKPRTWSKDEGEVCVVNQYATVERLLLYRRGERWEIEGGVRNKVWIIRHMVLLLVRVVAGYDSLARATRAFCADLIGMRCSLRVANGSPPDPPNGSRRPFSFHARRARARRVTDHLPDRVENILTMMLTTQMLYRANQRFVTLSHPSTSEI